MDDHLDECLECGHTWIEGMPIRLSDKYCSNCNGLTCSVGCSDAHFRWDEAKGEEVCFFIEENKCPE